MNNIIVTKRIAIFLLAIAIGAALGLYLNFFAETSVTVAGDILKPLIDADVGLLALLGVIAVYVLTSYQSFGRIIEERLDRLHSEHRMRTDFSKELPEYLRNISEEVEVEYKQYIDAVKKWEDRFDKLQIDSRDALRYLVVSAISFVISIMLSLGGMGSIDDKLRFAFIYFSSTAFIMGVGFIIGMIYELGTNLRLSSHEKSK